MAPPIPTRSRGEASRGLVERLLDEQQLLTPVADFSRKHDRGEIGEGAGHYRDLLPATPLMRGEQYAFEVELDRCSGCKACVTACHSLNGLDDNETWREVGLLINEPRRQRGVGGTGSANTHFDQSGTRGTRPSNVMQHVTTACHHCVDPACLNGCPVLAYEKDPLTGIVRHLDDQCIGCQYCVLKCPYDVPKYNARLGIVRKCDMCAGRLAVGEPPACAQACPNEAIRITKVETRTVRIEFREHGKDFLNGAPAGDYTLPTTRYVTPTFLSASSEAFESRGESGGQQRDSKVSLPAGSNADATQLVAADGDALLPQPAHWPLVVMLVLSQASVGVTSVAALQQPASRSLLLMSLALAVFGLGASVFHLGRPLGAWRAFLNLRRSWMSREIVVFGIFLPMLAAAIITAELSTRRTRSSPSPLNGERAGVRGGEAKPLTTLLRSPVIPTPRPNPPHEPVQESPADSERPQILFSIRGRPESVGKFSAVHGFKARNVRPGNSLPGEGRGDQTSAVRLILGAAVCVGLLGVFCSVMIYHDTRRPLWHWRRSLPLFFGTTLALGAAAAAVVSPAPFLFAVVIVATSAKVLVEVLTLRRVTDRALTPLKKTALLVTGRFQSIAFARLLCAMLGGIGLPLLLMLNVFPSVQLAAALAFGLLLAGELLERFLFFTAVVAPKMPGGLPA